ncbi:CBN-WRT-4 protein [Caenorhabditis brenneri]|uniref:CBN-WRT-4 protein n=1 Tax=Caenorhabditis brenneri TaxID=135651 RepID=G0MAQ5_CAEBE|nr:CBN-WRT-4 protein [Caenorhabditis brenneri]
MRSSLFVIVLLVFCYELAYASECGGSTIPYSLEVLPSGQPILGCARPTCFGWHPTGHQLPTTAKFFRIDQQSDGFLRDDPLAIHAFDAADPRIYSQQQATCEHEFQSLSCNPEDQWVGGISPVMNATTTKVIAYQCCTYPPLRASMDRGIATVAGGQIVVGGEVFENNKQYAFDYISNIEKKLDEEGDVFYEVNIRRFSCLDLQKVDRNIPDVLNAENIIRHVNGQRAVAHQAPNVAVQTPIEAGELVVPAGVVNGQEVIIEEIVAQQGFIQETTEVPPPPPPPQPQPGFQPQPFQPQPFQPQPFQPQVFQPVQQPVAVPAQPSGYLMGFAPPAGLQLYYCFPGDATVFSNGEQKRMDELKEGDWVQALTEDGMETISVPIKYWLHRDPSQEATFIRFSLDNGETFELTEKHLVYVAECKIKKHSVVNIYENPIPAEKVNIGDCFYIGHRNPVTNKMYQTVKVLGIDLVRKTGIYAPLTSVGNLLVNRIHTSCLSETDNHVLQDTFFTYFLRAKNSIMSFIWGVGDDSTQENLGYGANGVLELLDLVVPSKLI